MVRHLGHSCVESCARAALLGGKVGRWGSLSTRDSSLLADDRSPVALLCYIQDSSSEQYSQCVSPCLTAPSSGDASKLASFCSYVIDIQGPAAIKPAGTFPPTPAFPPPVTLPCRSETVVIQTVWSTSESKTILWALLPVPIPRLSYHVEPSRVERRKWNPRKPCWVPFPVKNTLVRYGGS